eukprot:5393978-Pyramimonas_sp.AAC.1
MTRGMGKIAGLVASLGGKMTQGFQSTHRSIADLGTQLNARVDSVKKNVQQAMTDIDAINKK